MESSATRLTTIFKATGKLCERTNLPTDPFKLYEPTQIALTHKKMYTFCFLHTFLNRLFDRCCDLTLQRAANACPQCGDVACHVSGVVDDCPLKQPDNCPPLTSP